MTRIETFCLETDLFMDKVRLAATKQELSSLLAAREIRVQDYIWSSYWANTLPREVRK